MMIPYGTPCDIDELCQIHVYKPYIDNQINRKVSGAYGGEGHSTFRSDCMIFSLICPPQGGTQLWKWRDDRTDSKLFLLQINTNNTHRLALFVCWEMSMASQMCNKSKTLTVFFDQKTQFFAWKT